MLHYRVSWREVWTEWTPGQAFLFLERILARNAKHKPRKAKAKTMTEDELLKSDWMMG